MVSTLYPIDIQIRGGVAPFVKRIYFEDLELREKWIQILIGVTGSYPISDYYRLDQATHILMYPNTSDICEGQLVAKNNLQDIKIDEFNWRGAEGQTIILKGVHKDSLMEVDIKMTNKTIMTTYEIN